MWTMLGGEVGMPMTTFYCALAASGSASATTAIAASVEYSLRM
jgi:hypothetical protein